MASSSASTLPSSTPPSTLPSSTSPSTLPPIVFSDEYSPDKSKIKDVFRSEPMCAGIELVADDCETGVAPSFSGAVRTIFEDASVRLAQGPPGPSGRDLYESFASSADWHWRIFPAAHTFVMMFDDKRHVPTRKRSAQRSRRETLDESMRRRGIVEWRWDGQSTILSVVDDTPLPPWERIRADAAAYARVIDELHAHLDQRYSPPAGRRLIIDTGRRVSVVEAALDGTVLQPREILHNKPPIGEGDMAALFYARRAMSPVYERESTMPKQQARVHARRADADTTLMHYYARNTSPLSALNDDADEDHWVLPDSLRPDDCGAVAPSSVRRHYDAGSVVWRSVDTDFLSLAIVCLAGLDDQSYVPNNLYVALGRVHRLDDKYCTSTKEGARQHQEYAAKPLPSLARQYYDMKRIYAALCSMHSAPERCIDTAWSFVAFCIACGNDYTRRLHNLSHKTMFSGYKRAFVGGSAAAPRRRLVTDFVTSATTPAVPLLNADAFVEMVRHAYYERLPQNRRPVHSGVPHWREMSRIVREAFAKNERAHMPDADAIKAYFNQVSWSLAYASGGSYGTKYVP